MRGRGGAKWARRVAGVLGDWGAGRDGQRQAGPSGKPCPLAPRADRCQRHGRLACSGEGGRASALGEACAPQALEQSVLQRPGLLFQGKPESCICELLLRRQTG